MRPYELSTTGLYLEPATLCSLSCALCYTEHATQRLLPEEVIFRSVELMLGGVETLGVFWCGLGEVYQDRRFVGMVEALDLRWGDRLLQTIQTNGQASRAPLLSRMESKYFLVSIDLPRPFMESHRGKGSYRRAVAFAARQLQGGALGVMIKCLLTAESIPHVAAAYEALLDELVTESGLGRSEVERLVSLEPILPFARAEVAAMSSRAFVAQGGEEDRDALLAQVAHWLPEHIDGLQERPRTLQLAVTYDGLFNCCEAAVSIGAHEELEALDYGDVMRRLRQSEPGCGPCALHAIC